MADLVKAESELVAYRKFLKTEQQRRRFIAELKIPTYKYFTCYNFFDVLHALSKHVFSIDFTQKKIREDKMLSQSGERPKTSNVYDENNAEDFDAFVRITELKCEQEGVYMFQQIDEKLNKS